MLFKPEPPSFNKVLVIPTNIICFINLSSVLATGLKILEIH